MDVDEVEPMMNPPTLVLVLVMLCWLFTQGSTFALLRAAESTSGRTKPIVTQRDHRAARHLSTAELDPRVEVQESQTGVGAPHQDVCDHLVSWRMAPLVNGVIDEEVAAHRFSIEAIVP